MKKKLSFKNIILSLIALLILIQFIRINKTTPSTDPRVDFISVNKPDPQIASILKTSCYDCHSHQVTYPWYTNIAPVSWWIKNHMSEGSHHLNFSMWATYSSRRIDHKLKECVEMVSEEEMPMFSYTLMHGDAKLTKEQRELLVNYFNSLRTHESDKPKEN